MTVGSVHKNKLKTSELLSSSTKAHMSLLWSYSKIALFESPIRNDVFLNEYQEIKDWKINSFI